MTTKFSQFAAATTLTGAEQPVGLQGGNNVTFTLAQFLAYFQEQPTAPFVNSLLPDADNTLNLGSPAKRWAYSYIVNGYFSTQLYVGATNVPVLNGGAVGYWPQSSAEQAASVTPTALQYYYGNVLRYGADNTGTADSTVAITNANLQAEQAGGARVWFPRGTYKYKPSATLLIGGSAGTGAGWWGEDVYGTEISVDTSLIGGGVIFQQTGSTEIRDLNISQLGGTKIGIGLKQSASNTQLFTGHQRLTRVWLSGFNHNLEINNVFMNTYDQCRWETGTEGLWCVPDSSGGNGYVTTLLFLNCFINGNTRNVHFLPPVNSYDVSFIGGAIQDATGAVAQADFQNIFTLKLEDMYTEGASAIPFISTTSVSNLSIDGLDNNGAGAIVIGDQTTQADLKGVFTIGTTGVLTCGMTTNALTVENSQFPAAGNTFPGANTRLRQTTINDVFYQDAVSRLASYGNGAYVGSEQVNSVTGAAATDCYRFLDLEGNITTGVFLAGRWYCKAVDHSTSANSVTAVLDVVSDGNGTTNATLTTTTYNVRGTNVGTSVTPFSIANDGAGGQIKLQFTKNAAVAQVDLKIVYMGILTT